VYGTNYEWEFDQDGATATITRDEEVDENWLVEFEIENDSSGDTRAISHEDGDDVFEIPLDELHVEDGEYEWELVIYNGPNSSNEDIAIRLPGGDEQLVTIGAVDEDTGDDSGTTESTGGSDSSESDDNSSGDESDDDSASSADEVPGSDLLPRSRASPVATRCCDGPKTRRNDDVQASAFASASASYISSTSSSARSPSRASA